MRNLTDANIIVNLRLRWPTIKFGRFQCLPCLFEIEMLAIINEYDDFFEIVVSPRRVDMQNWQFLHDVPEALANSPVPNPQ